MTIQRIESEACHSCGWQARATVRGKRYVSAYFADKLHGGRYAALALALEAEPQLEKLAARLRRGITTKRKP